MDCETCREGMLDVLYGEAPAATRNLVLEHHAVCASCREEFRSLTALRSTLARWQLPAEIESSPRQGPTWRLRLPYLAAAASFLLALAGSFLLFSRSAHAERELRDELIRQEARHREEILSLKAALTTSPGMAGREHAGSLNAAIRQLVEESEVRQAERFGARLSDLRQKTEAQRRYDLAQVSASLAYLEGKTGLQMARTTELMGHVLQASQKR
jgi:hypothetical protein